MKKFLFVILCTFFALYSFAEKKEVHALIGVVIKSSTKMVASVDFGDGSGERWIVEDKDEKKYFKSLFEPINYLIERGWKIVDFAPASTSSSGTVMLWVMKKEVEKDSEKLDGLKLSDK